MDIFIGFFFSNLRQTRLFFFLFIVKYDFKKKKKTLKSLNEQNSTKNRKRAKEWEKTKFRTEEIWNKFVINRKRSLFRSREHANGYPSVTQLKATRKGRE